MDIFQKSNDRVIREEDKELFQVTFDGYGTEKPRFYINRHETLSVFRVNLIEDWDDVTKTETKKLLQTFNRLSQYSKGKIIEFNDAEFDGDRRDKADFVVRFVSKPNYFFISLIVIVSILILLTVM
tara:strand:- start:25 stop:402 length:378 start_codon:yes stop_codon:yes gene_type:complete